MRGEVALLGALIALLGAGFRSDGTGHHPGATPPASWSATERVRWKTKLPTWSNASPVLVGTSHVCVCAEPVTLTCVDAATGAVRWSRENHVVDALAPEQRDVLAPAIADLLRRQAELPALMQEQSRLRRESRGSADPGIFARLEQVSQQVVQIHELERSYKAFLTPPVMEQIGWSTATPFTDGRSLWALFGNGVVARYEADGTRTWAVWLGEPPPGMRGYSRGTTASPQIVDGVLVIPFRKLTGMDPATGRVLWSGPEYTDYGTPGVARVGGQSILLTPNGDAVRVSDGRVLAQGLDEIYFVGPVTDGDKAWYVGGKTGAVLTSQGAHARMIRLVPSGSGLTAETVWTVPLAQAERVFSTPVLHEGRLIIAQENGLFSVLDAASGQLLGSVRDGSSDDAGLFGPTVVAGGRYFVNAETGWTFEITWDGATVAVQRHVTEGSRSAPLFIGGRLYLRTFSALWAIE